MNAIPLAIPAACLKQHLVVLGKTGAGKSSTLRHIVEHLLSKGKRVCIIDPKGDWHGLTSSADGKSEGFPVLMFGDFKNKRSDVPMDGRAGKTVAEVICSSDQSCVLGFRGWMPGDLTRFWIDFASTIFNHNAGELFLVIDEVHNFAAKGKIMDPEAGKCLHWTNRLASEGRGLNIKLLIASQRPQKVHNDTLTSCETLVAMRVIHEADREAIKSWIDGCGDREQGKTVLAELAQMKRGEAWVWSPESDVLERVKFPMFTTFDSFSEHATTAPKKWASVDVDSVKAKLERVVEEAKANDPKELRAQMTKLRESNRSLMELVAKLEQAPAQEVTKEVSVFTEDDRVTLDNIHSKITHMHDAAIELEVVLSQALRRVTPETTAPKMLRRTDALEGPLHPPAHRPLPPPGKLIVPSAGNGTLPAGERAVLIAAAQHRGVITREQATILTGYKRSTRDAYIQRLIQRGYIVTGPSGIAATTEGVAALGSDYEPLPTGSLLREYWLDRLPEGERAVLEEVCQGFGKPVDRNRIGEITGYKRSTRDAYIQRLSVRKLVVCDTAGVRAAAELFD